MLAQCYSLFYLVFARPSLIRSRSRCFHPTLDTPLGTLTLAGQRSQSLSSAKNLPSSLGRRRYASQPRSHAPSSPRRPVHTAPGQASSRGLPPASSSRAGLPSGLCGGEILLTPPAALLCTICQRSPSSTFGAETLSVAGQGPRCARRVHVRPPPRADKRHFGLSRLSACGHVTPPARNAHSYLSLPR